jgi:hypothetical protein
LARNVSARQESSLEAILSGLLLVGGGNIAGDQERVHDALILANAVAEHAAMIAVVVNAPLHGDGIAGRVSNDRGGPPAGSGGVVVNAHTSIVTTYTTSPHCRHVQVGPGRYWFKDCALGTSVRAGLEISY